MLHMEFNDICISQLCFDLLVTPSVGKKLRTNVMLSYNLFLSVMCVFKFCLSRLKKLIYFLLFSVATLHPIQCIISNKLTCTYYVCAFVVLLGESRLCSIIYLHVLCYICCTAQKMHLLCSTNVPIMLRL